MTGASENDGVEVPAASTGRPFPVLLALLTAGFGGALWLNTDAELRETREQLLERQRASADAAAARISNMANAAAAAQAAAGLSSDPAAILRAAAQAEGVSGAALFKADGSLLAGAGDAAIEQAKAAIKTAKNEGVWTGVAPAAKGAGPAIFVARKIDKGVLVSIIDAQTAARLAAGEGRLVLSDVKGDVLAAWPMDTASAGGDAATALGAPTRPTDRFMGEDPKGQSLAVGVAQADELRVFEAAEAPSWPEEAARAAIASALLAAAPFLTAALLLWLTRQDARRAQAGAGERALDRIEHRYRLAVDGARVGVFEWDFATDMISLSDPATDLLRCGDTELSRARLRQLAAPEDQAELDRAFVEARETGVLDASFRLAHAPSTRWIEMRGLALEDSEGARTRLVGAAQDASLRREAELRATLLQRRLREAIDSLNGPFALWDARKRLLMWNRNFQELFNLDGKVLRHGSSYESIALAMAAAIRRERPGLDAQMREIELNNGMWLQLQERRTVEGGLLTIGLDITTSKQQEDALKQSESVLRAAVSKLERSEGRNRELARLFEEQKRRAEDESRAKSAFLANMSHELRTPLNAVIGFSEIMVHQLYGPLGDARYHQYAHDVHQSGLLLLDLINDVLDMAKVEAGKFTITPRPLDPLDAVEQAVRLVRRRAEEKGLQIIVEARENVEIEADHRAVKQMLLNLLSNAVKFTDRGGILVEIVPGGGGVVLRVVDTGRGIAPEKLARIGRPFEQAETDLAREQPGTGLGLALTKSLVEMHGGRFELESQVGKGTVVSIWLPKAQGAAAAGADTPREAALAAE